MSVSVFEPEGLFLLDELVQFRILSHYEARHHLVCEYENFTFSHIVSYFQRGSKAKLPHQLSSLITPPRETPIPQLHNLRLQSRVFPTHSHFVI